MGMGRIVTGWGGDSEILMWAGMGTNTLCLKKLYTLGELFADT